MNDKLQPYNPEGLAVGENEFPRGRTVRGRHYITTSPCSDEQIVIMSMETWGDFGTTLESLRQIAKKQDSRIKELIAQVAQADLARKEADTRLNNLRDVRRAEKRADFGDMSSDANGPKTLYIPDQRVTKGR